MSTGQAFVRAALEAEKFALALKHLDDALYAPHHPGLTDGPAPLCREEDPAWKPPQTPARVAGPGEHVTCKRCLEWMHA